MNYSRDIQVILNQQNQNGGKFWSRKDGDIYHPMGHSTIETLRVLGGLGATPKDYPILLKAIEFIFEYQAPDGSFKYSKSSSKLPCMTAHILSTFEQLGVYSDKRLEKSYQQLLETQVQDGGWRCNTVKLGKSPDTDASNPGTTLYVLDAFRFRKNTKAALKQLSKGADFLLDHWETRKPLGPCDFGMGSRFFKLNFLF